MALKNIFKYLTRLFIKNRKERTRIPKVTTTLTLVDKEPPKKSDFIEYTADITRAAECANETLNEYFNSVGFSSIEAGEVLSNAINNYFSNNNVNNSDEKLRRKLLIISKRSKTARIREKNLKRLKLLQELND